MPDYVSPDEAQLCYDPWVAGQIATSMSSIQGMFTVMMVLMVGIFLFQIYLMKVRDNAEYFDSGEEDEEREA